MSDLGANCASSCLTRDHATFGECRRSMGLSVTYCQDWKGHDATREKKWNRELSLYEQARSEGIQPEGTSTSQIRQAMDTSDRTGVAFNADVAV